VTAHLYREADQTVIQVYVRDVTARRMVEEALRARLAEPRGASDVGTLGRLAGELADEFGDALTALVGHAELMAGQGPEAASAHADPLRQASGRAAGLIRQLVNLGRGKAPRAESIDLNALLTEMAGLLQVTAGKGVAIDYRLEPGAVVAGDRRQIEQIVLNLVIHARGVLPSGGRMQISTYTAEVDEGIRRERPTVAPGRHVVLTVADIAPSPERHSPADLLPAMGGAIWEGPGLPAMVGLVREAGGYIWAVSELGRGSTLEVFFPLAADAEPSPRDEPEHEPAGGDEFVVVVATDAAVREVACQTLILYGYTARAAATGAEAIGIAQEPDARLDLLLTEEALPDIQGLELAARLRALRPGVAVVYMSRRADSGQDHGGAFVEKPFTPRMLARKVREALDRATQGAGEES
jgi:two-component system cell cycle sensor histidine kinase/response regulator CckA